MEALCVVGSALLSTTFDWLLTKMDSSNLLNFAKQDHVCVELNSWRSLLFKIRAVLEDAEQKQITDPFVKIWLVEVRDLAFDMEDILDEFPFEVPESYSIANPEDGSNMASNVIWTCFVGVRQHGFMSDLGIYSKINDITRRLHGLSAEINGLGLNLIKMAAGDRSNKLVERVPTTSLVEPGVCGRQNEKEEILRRLLRGENDGPDVVPIVGMGGIGKTTLTQLVYNDESVTAQFDFKAWVCVSEQFDLLTITRTILVKVTSKSCEYSDLDSLQVRLKEELSGKRFLFILDDVWNENFQQWDLLQRPFSAGAQGSKIIVTTRHRSVASMMGNVAACHLKALPYEECLSIIAQNALGRTNFDAHPNIKDIGEAIVKRCKGLPLAAKTLGGLLRSKRSHDEWEDILISDLWDLPKEGNDILPALRLSYQYLPSHLKQCFAYCAVFPKGYEFDKDDLVFLWMAEGLIPQDPKGMKLMEDFGHEYFSELLARAFFQQSSSRRSRVVMHDLMNDLAQFVAGETCYNLTDKFKHGGSHESFKKVRYFSFWKQSYDTSKRFDTYYNLTSLRAFLPFSPFSPSFLSFLSDGVLHDFLPKLRFLRALSLCDYHIRKLPQSIEELKHLRYLNLSGCLIRCLPESVGSLFYLQTLILRKCNKLTKLPATIGNLLDLRLLDVTDTPALKDMPAGMGMLKSLLTLPKYIVGKSDGLRIRELSGLSHLRGRLCILKLHNVSDVQDARLACLNEKEGLDELGLEWNHGSRNVANEMQVLGWLKPHHNLKRLTVKGYGAEQFPSWVGDPLFSHVTHLELIHCRRITSLPSLGRLLSLKTLIIKGMVAVKVIGFECVDYGLSSSIDAFPSLKELKFEDMSAWEEWSFSVDNELQRTPRFHCLEELHIHNCPKLIGKLPSFLPSLKKLNIHNCPRLTYSSVCLPSLRQLNLEVCNEVIFRSMIHLTSLRSLKMSNISHLTFIPNQFNQDMVALEEVKVEECGELKYLWENGSTVDNLVCLNRIVIKKCPLFGFFGGKEQGTDLPCNLEILDLHDCDKLKRLPNRLLGLTSLRTLRIKGCKALKSLEGITKIDSVSGSSSSNMRLEKIMIRNCPSLISFPKGNLPPTLEKLVVEDCELLGSLPDGIMSNGDNSTLHLKELIVANCPSLKSFPEGKFPASLTKLLVEECCQLQFLPEEILHLEDLRMQGLSSLTSFPNGQLTESLKNLTIFNCRRLQSFPDKMLRHGNALETIEISHCTNLKTLPLDCFHEYTCLVTLVISCCDGLEYFPETGILAPNLKFLRISRCKNLKSLPDAVHKLKSLEVLKVKGCPSITSIPETGLPPNLSHLFIDCENLKQSMSGWGLDRLISLRELWINRICPPETLLLPTSVIELYIRNVDNMKSLPERLLENLSYLQVLDISGCYQLQSLPKEGLPPSLGSLRIDQCPVLQQWCLENGDYRRSVIARIPCVWIR